MAEQPRFDPLGTRAYSLFRSEIGEHVERVRALLSRGVPTTAEEAEVIGRTCHTIKGGAGFFGLTEVARVAGTLEAIFLGEGERSREEIEVALQSLITLSQSLPEPTGGVERCRIS